ncbi:MAG: ABC transporter permease [Gemmatimonadota bacterium]|nr:ABC transporter permease [Gemmatimonadota bacterium]MXY79960.1 ABC transporter permease [Chloroflexota bacterium]
MLRFIVTRLLSSILGLWIVSVLSFLLMNVLPGDPTVQIAGIGATPELIEHTKERLGLNDPLPERYARWLLRLLQGDLGLTLLAQLDQNEIFRHRIPPTVELGVLSLFVVVVVAVPVGILAALRPGSKREVVASTAMIGGNSIPEFLTGIALIILIGVELDLLPVLGYVPIWEDPVENLKHMAMPVIAVSLTTTALLMRQTRSAMINVLNDDYIRTARAKGLPARVVLLRHGLRNALIPIVTVFGFQAGLIFSGSVVTETVFGIPGMGRFFVRTVVETQDYLVVQNLVMFFAVCIVIVNLLVDLSYPLLDPRIRSGRGGNA